MEIKPYVRKVNFYETDQMAIVHHSNYIRWFEEARTDYLDRIGYSYAKVVAAGIDLAVIDAYMMYHSMVRYGERVHIYAELTELTVARMRLDYRIVDAETGALRTEGYTGHCYYDGQKQVPVSLKKALPDLYELFESLKVSRKGSQ